MNIDSRAATPRLVRETLGPAADQVLAELMKRIEFRFKLGKDAIPKASNLDKLALMTMEDILGE